MKFYWHHSLRRCMHCIKVPFPALCRLGHILVERILNMRAYLMLHSQPPCYNQQHLARITLALGTSIATDMILACDWSFPIENI